MKHLFAAAIIAGMKSSPLLQVLYSLIVLILVSVLNTSLQQCPPLPPFRDIAVSGVSASYYIYYLLSTLSVNVMVLGLNGGFLDLCMWTVARDWLKSDLPANERSEPYTLSSQYSDIPQRPAKLPSSGK